MIDAGLERSLLSAILRDPSVFGRVAVSEELFTRHEHVELFRVMRERFLKGGALDGATLIAWVTEHDLTKRLGGYEHLQAIIETRALDPRSVTETLARLASKRQGLNALRSAAESFKDPNGDHREVLSDLVAKLSNQILVGGNVMRVADGISQVFEKETKRADTGTSRRLRTGLLEFDRAFGGLSMRGTSLVIMASGMGKTTLANTLALSLAATQGAHVVIHGTETTEEERIEDLLFSLGRIDPDEWDALVRNRQRDMFQEDRYRATFVRASHAANYLSELPISLSSKRGGTIEAFCARLRALKMAGRVDLAIVDYIQDFQWSRSIRAGEQTDHVGWVTTMLKDVAADLGVPIVMFAQRSDEKRGITPQTARPQMWDCQYSSRAHQDAEEVFAGFRNDYYVEQIENWPASYGKPGVIELIRRKVRRGRRGTAELPWDGPTKWIGHPLPAFSPMPR